MDDDLLRRVVSAATTPVAGAGRRSPPGDPHPAGRVGVAVTDADGDADVLRSLSAGAAQINVRCRKPETLPEVVPPTPRLADAAAPPARLSERLRRLLPALDGSEPTPGPP